MAAVALPPFVDRSRVAMVAMDLDRTILPPSLELSPAIVAAVAAVKRAGIVPVVATGRMFASARPFARELGIEAPLICYQGALVADPATGEWLYHRPMDVALADEVIGQVETRGFHMNVYVNDELYVSELSGEALTYARHARLEAHPVGDLRRWLSRPTTKIVVVGEPEPLGQLEADLRGVFDGRLFIAKSLPFFLEVAMPGVSKGAALRFVCERLEIEPAACIAFGDGANDVELLQDAGIGVAVADADPALLPHADWVVPPVAKDGVARFLAALAEG